MKKIVLVLTLLIPFALLAQKEIKPSVAKAEKALKEGKFDEAKAVIDVTVASDEVMKDKKGNPSKNAAKAWYLRGLIYAGIDTAKVEKFKSLDPDPYKVAVESFNKSKEIDAGKTASFVSNAMGIPLLNDQNNAMLAQAYLNKSMDAYQKEKDYKKALNYMEHVIYFIPNDTAMLMNAGVYFAPQAEDYPKAIDYINQYHAKGGKNSDSYVQLFSIYRDKLKDNDNALKTAQEMVAKYPNNTEFPKYLLDMYVKTNKLPDAKAMMEKTAAANPSDKESRYFLGIISQEMKDEVSAQKWYNEAVKIDANYYDPIAALADLSFKQANKTRAERNAINGTKPADIAKRKELFQKIEVELKSTLTYYEKLETLKPEDDGVLYGLLSIYGDLSNYDEAPYVTKIANLKAKMKKLGLEVD